jgi:hypothetical protein
MVLARGFNKLVIILWKLLKVSQSYVNKNWHDSCNREEPPTVYLKARLSFELCK